MESRRLAGRAPGTEQEEKQIQEEKTASVDPKASGIIFSSALKSCSRRPLPVHQRKVPCHFWRRGKRRGWARGHRPQARLCQDSQAVLQSPGRSPEERGKNYSVTAPLGFYFLLSRYTFTIFTVTITKQ